MKIKVSKFKYGKNSIIENLDLEIRNNDKIAIEGKNGIGKSTLFNLIVGKNKSKIEIENPKNYGYFGKDSNLNLESTLEKEVRLFDKEINFEKYGRLVEGLNFDKFKNKKIKNLSQGNQIKAELIFTLSLKSKEMFLLDEPTESLDRESILFLSNYIKESSQIFIVISHDKEFVNDFSTIKYTFENKKLARNV
ncbi:ATP-binding cassette domain-containing protein [Chryseobacterium sp. A321]